MNDKTKRLLSALIDFCFGCFMSSAFAGIVTLGKFDVTPFSISVFLITIILYAFFKDFTFKNVSIGKRIFNLRVEKTDGTKLTNRDLIKRNVPIVLFLWPVEFFLLIFNNHRIGDTWAKTSVVSNNPSNH